VRQRISLHGEWERWVHGALYDRVVVPSSMRPSGLYRLKRDLAFPQVPAGERAFLHFDAITYHARVFINDVELGTMGPYVPYEFEVTRQLRSGDNHIAVLIADLTPEPGGAGRDEIDLGHTPGWEAYGGIIRDVWMERRRSAFIRNVRFSYDLPSGYTKAACQVRAYVSSNVERRARVKITMAAGQAEVVQGETEIQLRAGDNEAEISFEVANPALWSPDEPNLYKLHVSLTSEGIADEWQCLTGFRSLEIRRNKFVLNGHPITLAGVCRHDMWQEQGFTLTVDQMRRDMRMIKSLGANYVRLVHYPHDRRIVELADELGLLVSDEPGFWQVDFAKIPRGRIQAGLQVLERVIQRDWNSPSVMAWILGNESQLTVEYLKEGKALCNRIDPLRRFVSFANHLKMEEAKPIFEQSALDFFSQHLYDFSDDKFAKTAAFYGDSKPLVLTEWGWEVVGGPQVIYERTFDPLLNEVKNGRIAGHAFWSWQDVREYSRSDWATRDGILLSGVVSEARDARDRLHMRLARLFLQRFEQESESESRPEIVPLRSAQWAPGSRFQPIDLQPICAQPSSLKAWSELEALMEGYWPGVRMARDHWKRSGGKFTLWRDAPMMISGARFRVPTLKGHARPLLITGGVPQLQIPVGANCRALHILGNVTMPDGYPIASNKGAVWGVFRVRYTSGKSHEIPLRHGFEVARANMIHRASRIDPMALEAPRALSYTKDPAREHLQALLFSAALDGGTVAEIGWQINSGESPLAIFAVTAELG
jgi:beta-glucuronidase